MKVIAVANEKGGAGKSTLTINLAWGLGKSGFRVLVADTDPQKSILTWIEQTDATPPFTVEEMPMQNFHKLIGSFASDFDYCIVDTPGRLQVGLGSVLKAADTALISYRPSPLDIWASVDVANLIENWSLSSDRAAYFVPTGFRKGTKTADKLLPFLADEYSIPILNGMGLREAYIWPLVDGGCVYTSGDRIAIAEVDEIVDLIKG